MLPPGPAPSSAGATRGDLTPGSLRSFPAATRKMEREEVFPSRVLPVAQDLPGQVALNASIFLSPKSSDRMLSKHLLSLKCHAGLCRGHTDVASVLTSEA